MGVVVSHYNILFLYILSINLRHFYLHKKVSIRDRHCVLPWLSLHSTLYTLVLLSKLSQRFGAGKGKTASLSDRDPKRAEKDPQKHSDRDFLVNLTRQKKILKFFSLLYINKGLWL